MLKSVRDYGVLILVSVGVALQAARADVGPPVEINIAPDAPPAVAGQEYASEFLVQVYKSGTLTDFRVKGDGWTILSIDAPTTPLNTLPTILSVPFRAIPSDPEKPIGLSVKYDGRRTRQLAHVGPAYLAQASKPKPLMQVRTTSIPPQLPQTPQASEHDPAAAGGAPRGDGLIVRGRIVYIRPGIDRSDPPDGDTTDPDDTPELIVGADMIDVRVIDNDPVSSEEMWSGFTDEHGYFDTGVLDADVDGDGSGPDLIIYVETETPGWVDVTDNSVFEYTYTFETPEVEDYEGSVYDAGWLAPTDTGLHPALHIYNSFVRVRRWLIENPGFSTPEIQIEWPDDSGGNNSWFVDSANEIHISSFHNWFESVHMHEYGHFFLDELYEPDPPSPEYCNAYCDANDPIAPCGGGWTGCGHCDWCPETDHDAWNEGWPDWLASIVTRGFPERYTLDREGPAYAAYSPFSGEWIASCCQDGSTADATLAEGFITALLRDIDDPEQDDHDDDPDPEVRSFDGIRDQMCKGWDEIFHVLNAHRPITIMQFINAYLAEFPEDRDLLWPTAFNVGPAYVAGIPSDTQPPGRVLVCDSPSHPLGAGGSLACMTLEWEPARDDVTGACAYSHLITQNPLGEEPDEVANAVWGTEGCRLATGYRADDVGDWYFCIKAQDNDGNWSSQWSKFGPFTVVDCNGSGFLDLCDLYCASDGIPGVCESADICNFPEGSGCGESSDCNENYQPDECDIAQGQSEDCNQDGIPDECQTTTLKHWSGADPTNPTWWHLGSNWAEGAAPAPGNDACMFVGPPPLLRRDAFTLGTLASGLDLTMAQAAGLPAVSLTLLDPSFILGDLTQSSGTIQVDDELTISGRFSHSGGTLRGVGQTTVLGGHTISGSPSLTDQTLNLECDTTASGAFSGNNFTIRNFAGHTYNHNGTGVTVADGNAASVFINEGTFVKSSGAGTLRFGLRVTNSGLIRADTGTLSLRNLTSTGDVLGLPGTTLEFGNGTADLEPGSSLVGDLIWPRTSGTTVNVRGTYQAANTTVGTTGEFPTLNFLPGANIVDYGANFNIALGTANFRTVHGAPIQLNNVSINGLADFDSGDPVVIQTLTLGPSSGQLRGDSQQFTINGLFTWRQVGNIFDIGEVHANGGIMIEASSSQRDCARILYNAATATFLGAIGTASTGRFYNLPTGTALLQGDSTGVTGGRTTNEGTIVKTAGVGRSTLAVLTNSGLVHAQTGEMYFYFGGTNNGEIRGDPGTLLTFNNAHEMSPASTLIADDITFTGQGTSNIRGAVNIADTVTDDGGTLVFTDEANVASYGQHLNLVSGTVQYQAAMAGPVLDLTTVTVRGNVYFNAPQPVSIDTLTLATGSIQGSSPITVNGLFTFNSGNIFVGGLLTSDGQFTINSTGGTRNLFRNLHNAGTMTFVSGAMTPSSCTVTNLATGEIVIPNTGATFGLSSSATLLNDGRIVKSAGDGVSTIGCHFRNSGKVDVQIGTLQFTGTNGITNIQTAGETILNGGNLAVTSTGTFQMNGGRLRGAGSVTGSVTNAAGEVAPGMSAGALTITGAYSQGAAGTLVIEIGGPSAGDFDTLTVGGTATLAGALDLAKINGFNPAPGATFVVLSAAGRSGEFASVTGASGFEVSYTPTQVILTAVSSGLPGDLDGDCDVDIADLAQMLSNYGTPDPTAQDGDLDGDGDVDIVDLAALLSSYGDPCP